ncbi:MAG TPA: glycosyltransferase family 4 protein [Candidatus Elarobacter sp.]
MAVLCDRVGIAGGAERYWETVIPALQARGLDVRLFAREVTSGESFDARPIRWADEAAPDSVSAAHDVAEALRELRPQTVITASVFDCAVLDAVRAAPARWLVRVHDHRPFCPTGDRVYPQFSAPCSAAMGHQCRLATLLRGCVRGPRVSSLRAIAARERVRDRIAGADGVLVSSEHMRATCTLNGIDGTRVAITPPPLPDAAFADPIAPPPATPTLLFAARPTARKGLASLIRALGRIARDDRPRLVVAGLTAGADPAALEAARAHNVEIEWRGMLDQRALRDAIDAASAVAVPSLWPEPFGLVGIEAQARGRPAVAYRVGGIPEWIGGAGIAVARGDERALAEAIRSIVNPRRWPAYAAAARSRAEAYRLDAHVTRLLEVCHAA